MFAIIIILFTKVSLKTKNNKKPTDLPLTTLLKKSHLIVAKNHYILSNPLKSCL